LSNIFVQSPAICSFPPSLLSLSVELLFIFKDRQGSGHIDTGSIIESIDGVSGGEREPVIFTAGMYDLRDSQDKLLRIEKQSINVALKVANNPTLNKKIQISP